MTTLPRGRKQRDASVPPSQSGGFGRRGGVVVAPCRMMMQHAAGVEKEKIHIHTKTTPATAYNIILSCLMYDFYFENPLKS